MKLVETETKTPKTAIKIKTENVTSYEMLDLNVNDK